MALEEKKRKHKHDKKEKKDKSQKKQKTKVVEVQPAPSLPTSSFSEIVAKLYIHLAPMWSGKVMDGVIEQLNAFLMKYVPELDGIVLAHSDIQLLADKGSILYDSPFCHFFIRVKFLVWKPKKGSRLVGRINLQSQDHIGLLIYGTFNASIPSSRIPSNLYEWRASEDEAPTAAAEAEDEDEDEEGDANDEDDGERKRSQYGSWVHKETNASIGGDDGVLEFSVFDIVEANDILTVAGSL
ncbi:hypothetical protein DFQ28_009784 [Apophysomyces sp. BC1034]|nr:hypothetical protein DFQ30_001724 [Apophysomyces sp. BC1015]KAG0181420.1 hypothetical protein DFQ29_008387 [Apophysomyces sp. BC1021]KAG0194576.1 hypothetical protein DFQ28_009784 [Apophysomyces sp. BC1034]